jgi:hypothetical protein
MVTPNGMNFISMAVGNRQREQRQNSDVLDYTAQLAFLFFRYFIALLYLAA